MCGRYVSRAEKQEMARRAKAKKVFAELYAPNYNVAPNTYQAFLRNDKETDEREIELLYWKLIPYTAKSLDEAAGYSTTNARSEGIMGSNWYRRPFERGQRGIVLMSGFYEWKKVERERFGKGGRRLKPEVVKIPHYFTLPDDDIMGVAGLWDAYKEKPVDIAKRIAKARDGAIVRALVRHGEDAVIARALIKRGEKFDVAIYVEAEEDAIFRTESDPTPRWIQSFTIITCEANELMAPIHDRMPVIVPQRHWPRYLDRKHTPHLPLDLLRPYDADAMQEVLCNPLVNNVANNGPEMLMCPTPPQPPELLNSK